IETTFGYTATLVHLGSTGVQRGAHLTEGAVVGTVGPSGVVDGVEPFVYFGLRLTAEDQGYVDPLTFLPVRPAVDPPASEPKAQSAPVAEAAVAAPPARPDAVAAAETSVPEAAAPATTAPDVHASGSAPAPVAVEAPRAGASRARAGRRLPLPGAPAEAGRRPTYHG